MYFPCQVFACCRWTDPWESLVQSIQGAHVFISPILREWLFCDISMSVQCLYIDWLIFLYHSQVGICVAVVYCSSREDVGQQLHRVVTVQLYSFLTCSCKKMFLWLNLFFSTKFKLKISWFSHLVSAHFLHDCSRLEIMSRKSEIQNDLRRSDENEMAWHSQHNCIYI